MLNILGSDSHDPTQNIVLWQLFLEVESRSVISMICIFFYPYSCQYDEQRKNASSARNCFYAVQFLLEELMAQLVLGMKSGSSGLITGFLPDLIFLMVQSDQLLILLVQSLVCYMILVWGNCHRLQSVRCFSLF